MAAPQFETLNYAVEDRIATITLNRPEKMNAFNYKMMEELVAVWDYTDKDDDVGAVILTGAGRAFCAGLDLTPDPSADARPTPAPGEIPRDIAGRVTLRMFESLKPTISACNGAAVGVGCTMQLPMDIRLASTEARYGFVFARRGITVEGAATWFLPRIVGPSAALEWCMGGRIFGADEALQRGLVSAVHAPDDLLPAARAKAREIVDNSAPVSVSLTRQLMWRMMGVSHPMEAHVYESRALYSRSQANDRNEGFASFLEKRLPAFPDKVSENLPGIWGDWTAPEYR
ncbi:MAG: crotonase/enoyl-CoA hydratase family protein [Phenylobacterium sp.]